MSLRSVLVICCAVSLSGAGAARAVDITVTSMSMVQGTQSTVVVSGTIEGQFASAVELILELQAGPGVTGTLTFTPGGGPTSDIALIPPSPWPSPVFTRQDTNDNFSLLLNGAGIDSVATAAATTFSGDLAGFPVVASADAVGTWNVLLTASSTGASSRWIGPGNGNVPGQVLNIGTVTVTAPVCNNNADCDDADPCTDDSCDGATGQCVNTFNTAPCDDGQFCTISDMCDGAGTCTGAPRDCSGTPGAVPPCQPGSCNETLDQCELTNAPVGTACGNPAASQCDAADTCDGAGSCSANLAAIGAACGDATITECSGSDQCDGAGMCQPNDFPNTTPCGSGADTDCTNPDLCNGAGVCLPNHEPAGMACGVQTVPTTCDALDTCNGNGVCQPNFAASGTSCDDVDVCTENDTCDGGGTCGGSLIGGCAFCDA
ncbi:MAG: hypothetical protein ACE5EX_11855, partial [Phycisphaerae bacterium]